MTSTSSSSATAPRRLEGQCPGGRVPKDDPDYARFFVRPKLEQAAPAARHVVPARAERWEPSSANNAGRQLRSWIRFSHTGEAGGIPGETIAAIASLGATFLRGTGISLAIRRVLRSIAGRRLAIPVAEVAD